MHWPLRAAAAGRVAKQAYEASPEAGQAEPGFVAALIDDDLAYVSDWGFDPAAVSAPTLVVHGDADRAGLDGDDRAGPTAIALAGSAAPVHEPEQGCADRARPLPPHEVSGAIVTVMAGPVSARERSGRAT